MRRLGLMLAGIVGRGMGPVFALLALCAPAAAQGGVAPVGVVQVRGLSFVSLEPGSVEVVSPLDPSRRAEFVLVGTGEAEVHFLLPDALTAPEGARIPLSYGPLDGVFIAGPGAQPLRFDPRERQRFLIPAGATEARVYLGAAARPAPDQMAARYSAAISAVAVRPRS